MDVAQSLINEAGITMAISLFSVIGALFCAVKVGGVVMGVLRNFLRSGIKWNMYGVGKNGWAVVTGATDGIGKEYAKQLAAKGYNILLVSRTKEKLDKVADEIEGENNVETRVLPIDFASADKSDYARLKAACDNLPIWVLVNNVGVSHEHPEFFHEISDERMHAIIEVNINSIMKTTRIVLPQMLERKKGLILNMGSFSGSFPTPLLQVYSGSKSFVRTWTEALAEEVASSGVHVEHLNTYFVMSAMSKIRRPSLTTPTAKDYVTSALRNIGFSSSSVPYTMHNIVYNVFNALPESIIKSQNLSIMLKTRSRALKKKGLSAKKAN